MQSHKTNSHISRLFFILWNDSIVSACSMMLLFLWLIEITCLSVIRCAHRLCNMDTTAAIYNLSTRSLNPVFLATLSWELSTVAGTAEVMLLTLQAICVLHIRVLPHRTLDTVLLLSLWYKATKLVCLFWIVKVNVKKIWQNRSSVAGCFFFGFLLALLVKLPFLFWRMKITCVHSSVMVIDSPNLYKLGVILSDNKINHVATVNNKPVFLTEKDWNGSIRPLRLISLQS